MKAKRSAAVLAAVFSSRRPARKKVVGAKPDTSENKSLPSPPPHESDVGVASAAAVGIVHRKGKKSKTKTVDTSKHSSGTICASQPSTSIFTSGHSNSLQERSDVTACALPNRSSNRQLASNVLNASRVPTHTSQDQPSSVVLPLESAGKAVAKKKKRRLAPTTSTALIETGSSSPTPEVSNVSRVVTLPSVSRSSEVLVSSATKPALSNSNVSPVVHQVVTPADKLQEPAKKKKKVFQTEAISSDIAQPSDLEEAAPSNKRKKVLRKKMLPVSSIARPTSLVVEPIVAEPGKPIGSQSVQPVVPATKKKKVVRNDSVSSDIAQPLAHEEPAPSNKRKKVLREKMLPVSSVAQPTSLTVGPILAEPAESIISQPVAPRPRPGNGCYQIRMPRPVAAVDMSSLAFRLVATLTICRFDDVEEKLVQELDRDSWPPEALAAALGHCADRNQISCVRLLIKRGAPLDIRTGPNLRTALHIAARNGHVDVCSLLIEAGADQTGAREAVESLSQYGQLFAKQQAEIEALLR